MAYSEANNNSTTRKGQASYYKHVLLCIIFLQAVESSMYCPPGLVDSENGTGNVLDGRWRVDIEDISGMLAISHTGSNRYVNNISHKKYILNT